MQYQGQEDGEKRSLHQREEQHALRRAAPDPGEVEPTAGECERDEGEVRHEHLEAESVRSRAGHPLLRDHVWLLDSKKDLDEGAQYDNPPGDVQCDPPPAQCELLGLMPLATPEPYRCGHKAHRPAVPDVFPATHV